MEPLNPASHALIEGSSLKGGVSSWGLTPLQPGLYKNIFIPPVISVGSIVLGIPGIQQFGDG